MDNLKSQSKKSLGVLDGLDIRIIPGTGNVSSRLIPAKEEQPLKSKDKKKRKKKKKKTGRYNIGNDVY